MTKDEFLIFLSKLLEDYKINKNDWENKSLEDYLSALKAWVEDMDGYYMNMNKELPTDINWEVFSDILYAGKIYE